MIGHTCMNLCLARLCLFDTLDMMFVWIFLIYELYFSYAYFIMIRSYLIRCGIRYFRVSTLSNYDCLN